MIRIERILCPATFPLEADDALRYAVSLARAYEADLLICHCADPPTLFSIPGTTNGGSYDQIGKAMADALAPFIGQRAKSHNEVVVVDSCKDVGETIVATAREWSADLIVMRSRRSRVAALLGSTAEHVSRTASCPVLVIHEKEGVNSDSRRASRFSRVLVSHDFSSSSELALSYALSIAQKFRAELHLLHVLPEPEDGEPEIAWNNISVKSAYQQALQRLQLSVPDDIYEHCTVMHIVRWGKPYREVLAYTKKHDIDLVCMGALGSDYGLQALFGSNVDRVLRQAACPILVARPIQSTNPQPSPGRIAKPDAKKSLYSAALR